jgi:hypothetical protein
MSPISTDVNGDKQVGFPEQAGVELGAQARAGNNDRVHNRLLVAARGT